MTRLLLALAGTAALWPMFQFRPDHNAVLPGPARAYSWKRTLGSRINGGLAVVGGAVFVESFDRRVSALDARTGRVLWSTKLPNVAMTTPIVADGVVVVGTGKDAVLEESPQRTVWGRRGGDAVMGLDAGTGRVLWTHHTIGEDMPSPALVRANDVDEIVYANGHDRIRALTVAGGRTLWTIRTHGIATMSSVAAVGSRAYVVVGTSPNSGRYDRIEAIDARTGSIRWRLRTTARVKMSAVEYRRRLYFGDTAGTFYVVDARSGHVLLRRRFPEYFTISSPVIVGLTLYVADRTTVRAMPLASLRA